MEKHFYGKEGALNVDDEITVIERDFAPAIDELREKNDGDRISDERVLRFIVPAR